MQIAPYNLDFDPGDATYIVGSSPTQGLTFDVSCDATTQYGTIPLGPATSGQNTSEGNLGTPLPLQEMDYNIAFAPVSAGPTATPDATPTATPAP